MPSIPVVTDPQVRDWVAAHFVDDSLSVLTHVLTDERPSVYFIDRPAPFTRLLRACALDGNHADGDINHWDLTELQRVAGWVICQTEWDMKYQQLTDNERSVRAAACRLYDAIALTFAHAGHKEGS